MSIFWSRLARRITPYTPGEQPRDRSYIKLNTNENPYPPSPQVLAAIQAATDERLRLYPDPECEELCQSIARHFGINRRQVFVGNGSDELLAFCFLAYFDPGRPILFPDITYSFYPVYADLFAIDYRLIPLDADFAVPLAEFAGAEGGIILPNPNAPTGRALTREEVGRLLAANPRVPVVLDEAYIDFGGETAVPLIAEFPNLVVLQTLSKSRSLAGLRVGLALGQDETLDAINRIKHSFNSYTLDRLALAGAAAAFADDAYYREINARVAATRQAVTERLTALEFRVVPSQANFLFISHRWRPASSLFLELRRRGILVRYFSLPRIDNYLRVTMGTEEDMATFIRVMTEILAEGEAVDAKPLL